ncbi:sorting and assembly machinery component 50-like protein [Senna tora]|uniref:Sorting and assembly machinery component 50-like protein n=1 Tax=Senna tora TaxID=362788 RepID=A0A834TY46_9FABA|nr:sorting and assembly machinery component 50-like protein [Senna tora]
MENSEEEIQVPFPPNPNNGQETEESSNGSDEEDDYDDVEDDEDDGDELEELPARVHDVVIKGNTITKDWVIEGEVEGLRNASTMRELIEAAKIANANLHDLQIFDSVNISLEPGPPELVGTANVIIEVSEAESKLSGELGAYTKPSVNSWTLEGALKLKNLFGYGDLWDCSLAFGVNQTSDVSVGVFVPRLKGLLNPVVARVFLHSQDWHEYSSYKERLSGISLGLFSTKHHDLAYNLGWRIMTDSSQMSSKSIRRQLGHSLLSSLKYTFKIDQRNSPTRPTKGYAFLSTTQLGGLAPDHRSLRFLRQEFDVRYAVPFGFYNAALNLGISAGVIFPWGHGFLNKPSPLPERFFLGGDLSPVCTLGGPSTLWGFRTRTLGPTEPRRQIRGGTDNDNADSSGRDFIGGDLAVSALADLSFDLPISWLREHGIHGHIFAGVGNIAKLTENEFRHFSPKNFMESFRTSVGCGIVIPTKVFRLEANYYYILRQHEHDRGKTGFRFSFSAPS